MLTQLTYISSAVTEDLGDEIDQILESSVRNNKQQEVTGVLLYAQGTFFQVLEGSSENVKDVYTRILKDPRHKTVTKLHEAEIEERRFAEWSMGWSRIPDTHPNAERIAALGRRESYATGNKKEAIDTLIESFFELNQT